MKEGNMSIKLACAVWGFRELGLEEYFKAAVEAGIPLVEVGCSIHVPRHLRVGMTQGEIEDVLDLARDSGVEIIALAADNDFALADESALQAEVRRVKQIIDLAASSKTRMVRLFASNITAEEATEGTYHRVAACFNEVGRYAEGKGIRLALENHGGITSNAEGVLKIMQGVESEAVGLTYDVANFYRDSQDPLSALHQISPHVVHVHLKDYRRTDSGHEFCALGEGEIDYPPILEALSRTYHGYYAIEYEEPSDIVRGTRDSLSFLSRYLDLVCAGMPDERRRL